MWQNILPGSAEERKKKIKLRFNASSENQEKNDLILDYAASPMNVCIFKGAAAQ